jgi:hypothetical protein
MGNKINGFLISILIFVSIFAVAEAGMLLRNTNKTMIELKSTIIELKETSQLVHSYATSQVKNLEKQQRSIDASIQMLAVFNGTGRTINKVIIPRIRDTIDSANTAIKGINEVTISLNSMVKNTDGNINGPEGLLVQVINTSKKLNLSVEAVNAAVRAITEKSSLTLDDIHSIMSSNEWKGVLDNINSISKHTDGVMVNIENATKSAPAIAESLEKIAKTSSKYQKALILAQIISLLGRAF